MFGAALLILAQAATPAPARAPAAPAAQPEQVTRSSIQARVKANFDGLDLNKDGWVDKAEAQKAMDNAIAAATKQRADTLAADFAKLDTNKDGSISKQEFEALMPPVQRPANIPWMDGNDTDKNGRVSLSEANSHALATFDRLDTNHDGILSAAEAQAALQPPRAPVQAPGR